MDISPAEYRALAEFRYQIRKFLHFSETAAKVAGLEPQQHQLMLAVKSLSTEREPNISDLAEQLRLQHHSVVGLIDRLEERGLVSRVRMRKDRRQVCIQLTEKGEDTLRELSMHHREELRSAGRALVEALEPLLEESSPNGQEKSEQ